MLRMRLQRIGRRNDQHFRVVVTERTTSPKGEFIEMVGSLNPRSKHRSLNKERILYWLSKGARASDTVTNLLVTEKIVEGAKIPKHKAARQMPPKDTSPPQQPTGEGAPVVE